jgi:hypothetical protein
VHYFGLVGAVLLLAYPVTGLLVTGDFVLAAVIVLGVGAVVLALGARRGEICQLAEIVPTSRARYVDEGALLQELQRELGSSYSAVWSDRQRVGVAVRRGRRAERNGAQRAAGREVV